MSLVLSVIGCLMVLLGGVWIAQGVGVLPGSFMTGDVKWAMYGAVLALAGIALVVWSRRRRT